MPKNAPLCQIKSGGKRYTLRREGDGGATRRGHINCHRERTNPLNREVLPVTTSKQKIFLALGIASTAIFAVATAHAQPPRGEGPAMMADANNDGQVTRAEVEAAATKRFTEMDADKDGYVTKEEVDAARKAKFEARKKEFDEKRAEIKEKRKEKAAQVKGRRAEGGPKGPDANEDGRISRDEMLASATRRFDHADANNDGVLTKDEMRSRHRGPRGGGHMPPPPEATEE